MVQDVRAARGTVLVAAAEPTVRGHLRSLLTAWGFLVFECSTDAAALAAVRSRAIDLAILDTQMGTGEGPDFVSTLLESNPRLRIAMLDRYDGESSINGDPKARVIGTIGRPLSAKKMDRAISFVFGDL
jgi:DNA-binding NarL/FixJ family response regulator